MGALLRTVYDTTILASGIVATKDPIALIINAVTSGQVELVISPYILEELRRTLTSKQYFLDRITEEEREKYLSGLDVVATLIAPYRETSGIVTDPNDDPIIDLAISAHVEFLVTGDKRILAVGEYEGVKMITAREFYDVLNQQADS